MSKTCLLLPSFSLPFGKKVIAQWRLCWLGHVVRMTDGLIPKDLLYGELVQGNRPRGSFVVLLSKFWIRDHIANMCWIMEKAREFQKNYFSFVDFVWLCGPQQTMASSERNGSAWPPYLFPEKSICGTGSNNYNRIWYNWLVQNWERSTTKLYIVSLLI